MSCGTLFIITVFTVICCINAKFYGTYNETRSKIIDFEELTSLGGRLQLNDKEKTVNDLLLKVKINEVNQGMSDMANYAPSLHYFKAKPLIEKSRIFKFIKKMPKGANLHGHNTALVSSEWFIKSITYRPNIRICEGKNGNVVLSFRTTYSDCKSPNTLLSEKRSQAVDVAKFDKDLEKSINLYTPTPEIDFPDINSVWSRFQNMFGTVSDVIKYYPVFIDYHKQLLQEFYDDNVMYTEIRTGFGELYDDAGKIYSYEETAGILRDLVIEFTKTHPGFLGAKTIFAVGRHTTQAAIQAKMDLFKILFAKYSDFILGFDLVGQEDLGYPLINFQEQLKNIPKGAQFFFHAGETNWYGADTDLNLIDTVLLNTKRIGHGYALAKHPALLQTVKQRGIAIEISPLSNQILGLVRDLRNHPAAIYVAEDIPIVITNDDPGFWNAKGLSYDYYYALMSFAPESAGIRTLKQLVLNSLQYSILTNDERRNAHCIFSQSWDKFLDDVIAGNVI